MKEEKSKNKRGKGKKGNKGKRGKGEKGKSPKNNEVIGGFDTGQNVRLGKTRIYKLEIPR